MTDLKTTIVARIEAIKAAETVTKKELGLVSREMLEYVPETDDIDVVNRLLGVLTPMNKRTAILFFTHFLPWEVEQDKEGMFQRFGKRSKKEKQVAKKLETIAAFLSDGDNDIWTWAAVEVVLEYKPKDFAANITKAVQSALKGEKKDNGETPAISMNEVLAAVLRGGVSVEQMLLASEAIVAKMKEEAATITLAEAA